MKKSLFSILFASAFTLATNSQTVNIPDANFKAYLVGNSSINTNSDSEIQVSEATAFTGVINASSLSISDLTGIEAFTNVTSLYCDFNNLTSLDLSSNTALTNLVCNNNSIATLNVTGLSSLTNITAPTNNLTSIDISTNTALIAINVGINNLTSFDISSNANLTIVYCFTNNLTSLNMANGNNTNIGSSFSATGNPNLTCIQVDDVAWSTSNWTNIDPGASFSLNCCTINIPDANFKAYLVGNTSINTNADSEIQCSEASSFSGTINCQNMNISDLTGIEAFTSLTSLLCGNNPLGTIDVSQNTALTTFQPYNNNLSTLDVTNNTSLSNFVCHTNNLTSLDLSQNINLNLFVCRKNDLTTLDLSSNTNLSIFVCDSNDLTTLDLSFCPNLSTVNCSNNDLNSLNMKNVNPTASSLDATSNTNLTCIEVDDITVAQTNWTTIDPIANFSLNCNTSTSLNEVINSKANIYPNPASNKIAINGVKANTYYVIQNISGQTMLQGFINPNNMIDINQLAEGVYFIKLNNYTTQKFIKE